ncbi:MAG: DUF1987 domain-containing protein [Bacteroidia bacterium]|nr:DUF1987 domain-containing protein [Bacteroidia bacterium]
MEPLFIEETIKTPQIEFNADKGELRISGKSIPENTVEFFTPVFDWLEAYSAQPAPQTELKVALEYFNTSSSKCLLDIFRKLEFMSKRGVNNIRVLWLSEQDDEDMFEAGEDYRSIVKLDFSVEKKVG